MQLSKSEQGISLCTEGMLASFKDAQINFSYPCIQSFVEMVDAIGEVLAGHAHHAAFPVLQVALVDKVAFLHNPSLPAHQYQLRHPFAVNSPPPRLSGAKNAYVVQKRSAVAKPPPFAPAFAPLRDI